MYPMSIKVYKNQIKKYESFVEYHKLMQNSSHKQLLKKQLKISKNRFTTNQQWFRLTSLFWKQYTNLFIDFSILLFFIFIFIQQNYSIIQQPLNWPLIKKNIVLNYYKKIKYNILKIVFLKKQKTMEQEQVQPPHNNMSTLLSHSLGENNQFLKQVQAEQEQQLELEMLTEQCEELINKIFSPPIQIQQSFLSNQNQQQNNTTYLKHDKSRLQKQYFDLCVQIQRQQKQLQNYKFKIKVANKQAEYYSRQIKQKQQILTNLQKHQEEQTSRRKSFMRK